MNDKNPKSSSGKFRKWFKRKHKKKQPDPYYLQDELSDGDDFMEDIYVGSLEIDPCTSTNQLRIFVGTWNVAGRAPVGSLAVDLEEWLKPRDAVDIYVLGGRRSKKSNKLEPANRKSTKRKFWLPLVDSHVESNLK